jgi:phosphate transport system substrate-binding protein
MRAKRTLLVLLALICLLAAACSSGGTADEGSEDAGASEPAEGGDLSGEVLISGSSTVQPISQLVGEIFQEENPDVVVDIQGPGTGDGFELFCGGEIAIADASRPIDEEESAACEEAGIEFVEIQVAIDGLSVLTSPDNTAVTCLDTAALYALVGPESQGFATWSDASALAGELGSDYADALPDQPLDVVGPGEESGTYDTFVEFAIAPYAEDRGQEEVTRPDYSSSPNDNVILEGVSGSASSLGWVGFAFAENAGDTVAELEVAGEDGTCVAPTTETIADGSYPFSRPLFIYVSTTAAEEQPEVAAFVDYYLTDDGLTAVADAGYVDVPEDVLEDSRSRWEARETGSQAAEG